MKKSDFKPASDWIDALTGDRRDKIEAGARKILAEMHLAELRKAMKVSQITVAERTGLKQTEVSRIERAPETVQLRTLNRYVDGLGGKFKLVAEFPDGTTAEIPLRDGKPLKSRMKVAPNVSPDPTDRSSGRH
ncbi:helix-turn-helix domain-containing protein [Arvimicrobium flavum]|uniref:helix-turn-helix domain-containing protein n=1 Tax=Arvimicrobium flavum TaxID=3393320 RepID=UPI00237A3348|nr:helix-turn-helix transcriptional regulator [Mesorhizobium shangrilense]